MERNCSLWPQFHRCLKEIFFLCRNFAKAKGSNQRFLPQNGEKSPEFQRFLWPQLLENLKVFTYDERSYTKVAVLFALHHTVALNFYRLFGEFRKQRQYVLAHLSALNLSFCKQVFFIKLFFST